MAVTTEDIIEEFEAFGVVIKTEKLLEKCIRLCGQHGMVADQLAAAWLGFAATKSHDEMTLEYLDDFERDQLLKRKSTASTKSTDAVRPTFVAAMDHLHDEEDILMSYGASPVATAKRKPEISRRTSLENGNSPLTITPATPTTALLRNSHHRHASPHVAHLSPCVTKPSQRYSERSNSGAVASSYVAQAVRLDYDLMDKKWQVEEGFVPQIERTSLTMGQNQVMFEKLRETAALQEEAVLHMADQIAPAFGGDDCWSPLDVASNERVTCVGRVCCDSVGKLNAASVLLEGSRELSGAAVTQLDLSNVAQYALFPGQVIGVTGVNTTGSRLVVEEVVGGRVPAFPAQPITITDHTGPVQLLTACGPFTTSDNLLYEPLQDLLATVAQQPPHLLLLLGPLLDAAHPLLLEGSVTENYQAVVNRVIAMILAALAKCSTEVFIVASSRDVTSSSVYPTAPLSCGPHTTPRLHMLSDPSMVVVEGVAVALTTMDVIMDLGKEEVAFPSQQGDRLLRLVHHLLAQQVLYPVSPPPDHQCVSPSLLHTHASLNCKPHVLVLPSDIRNFVKDVCGCITVNPERLCKGMSGGCYARVELRAPSVEEPDRPTIVAAVFKV